MIHHNDVTVAGVQEIGSTGAAEGAAKIAKVVKISKATFQEDISNHTRLIDGQRRLLATKEALLAKSQAKVDATLYEHALLEERIAAAPGKIQDFQRVKAKLEKALKLQEIDPLVQKARKLQAQLAALSKESGESLEELLAAEQEE